ncbi:MAG: hypothetical protein H7A23_24935 [Leptospiraceae bacterium]|nr:hypothetical protein [Leptospiraceae bacterium]MCP5497812.1 hypothetical protein [Leptospiraceae bacterium]
MPINLILILGFLLLECTHFKVDKLFPSMVTRIKISQELDSINAIKSNNILVNLPLFIAKIGQKAYIADYQNSLVKTFNTDGSLNLVIGNLKSVDSNQFSFINYKLNTPGYIVGNENDDLYIQNRMNFKQKIESEDNQDIYSIPSGIFSFIETKSTPSYILHFNNNAKLLSILGATGKNSGPFRHIEKMYAMNKNLFVYHKFAEQMILSYYVDDKIKGSIQEGALKLSTKEEFQNYKIKLDTMIPHLEGKYALVSVSYYDKNSNRFKFRKILKLEYNNPTPIKLLKEIQDPSEFLFMLKQNNEFYIWKTESDGLSIKLQIHDENGNHINNKKISFSKPTSDWRTTYNYNNESIFSIKINSDYLELYEWK